MARVQWVLGGGKLKMAEACHRSCGGRVSEWWPLELSSAVALRTGHRVLAKLGEKFVLHSKGGRKPRESLEQERDLT